MDGTAAFERCDVGRAVGSADGGEGSERSAAEAKQPGVCGGGAVPGAHRSAVAGSAGGVWALAGRVYALSPVGKSRGVAWDVGEAFAGSDAGIFGTVRGQHPHTGTSARCWGAQKNGPDQALGRSRGGLTTKLHAATTDEDTAVGLSLTCGQRHDLIGFDPVYEQACQAGTPSSLAADRAYDADALRARMADAKVQCVIPGKCNRIRPIAYSKKLYRRRHKVENWFRKIMDFRRVATRYDKLACCFLAVTHLASAVILLRAFVNTP